MQLNLEWDRSLTEVYETCREFVGQRVREQFDEEGNRRQQKSIAGDMDLSPSHLARKLAQADSMRFTLDDLESYIQATGDVEPIFWLLAKYAADKTEARIVELESELAALRAGRAA